jgi:hypothetical protein
MIVNDFFNFETATSFPGKISKIFRTNRNVPNEGENSRA